MDDRLKTSRPVTTSILPASCKHEGPDAEARQRKAEASVQRCTGWRLIDLDKGNTKSDSVSMLTYRKEMREVR